MELQSWLTIRLENYLKQYPDDQQYLIDAMELDLTDIPKELKHSYLNLLQRTNHSLYCDILGPGKVSPIGRPLLSQNFSYL